MTRSSLPPIREGEHLLPEGQGERIAKLMARSGVASRRDAERLIGEGRVTVNGRVLMTAALNVGPDDVVAVDDVPIARPQAARLWRYYKPAGLVTTHKDPEGRPTVFDHLPKDLPRVVSVGRLDLNSEGLLLLTTDGALARTLELPANGWARRYRVRIHGFPDAAKLAALSKGVTIEGIRYAGIEATVERQQGTNAWLLITLREGKNREIRRVMDFLGYPVNRLIRIGYGPFHLGKMAVGAVEEVPPKALGDLLTGMGAAVPEGVRRTAPDPSRWAKAKPRAHKPGHARGSAGKPPEDRARKPQGERPQGARPAGGRPGAQPGDRPGSAGRPGPRPPRGPRRDG